MVRVSWIMIGPPTVASSRIHGYRIHEFLLGAGWQSEILFGPPRWTTDPSLEATDLVRLRSYEPTDIVVFQKVNGSRTVALLRALKRMQIKTIYIDCDLPIKPLEASLASVTVCSSSYLAAEYQRQGIGPVTWIPDAYEVAAAGASHHSADRNFTCGWFGLGTKGDVWRCIEAFRQNVVSELPNWSLITISDHPAADRRWTLETCWSDVLGCDAVTIPASPSEHGFAKSANKIVQAMALGLPVAAYPIPSYAEVIQHGVTGFLCRAEGDWKLALRTLEDRGTRQRISECGRRFAWRHFSIEHIGRMWQRLLQSVIDDTGRSCCTSAHSGNAFSRC